MNALGDKASFTLIDPSSAKQQQNLPRNCIEDVADDTEQENNWTAAPYPPAWHLQTMRLNIRPYHINDAAQLSQNANDAQIAANMTDRFPHPYTLDDARSFINHISSPTRIAEARKQLHDIGAPPIQHFAICLRESEDGEPYPDGGLLIGGIGVDKQSDVFRRGAEIGYWLARPHWGRGYATEAIHEFVEWLFDGLAESGLTGQEGESILRLSAGVFEGNEKSIRVLERVGFVVETRLKDAVWKRNEVRDLIVLGMTRRQWETRAAVRTVQG